MKILSVLFLREYRSRLYAATAAVIDVFPYRPGFAAARDTFEKILSAMALSDDEAEQIEFVVEEEEEDNVNS